MTDNLSSAFRMIGQAARIAEFIRRLDRGEEINQVALNIELIGITTTAKQIAEATSVQHTEKGVTWQSQPLIA